ncbi:hypothetical protein RJ55_08174 [Drechmeria coniospora]|nr:hypothetical protein RJ55_08174 [Drechmeria coniospora]
MDGSPYPSNGINTNSAPQTYPSPTAASPNQLGSPTPQTLPPLQPPTSAMQPMYNSHPHTPRTPGTPNTPNSTGNVTSYQNTSQPSSRPGMYSMAQNPYPPHQGYGTTSAMMPQATTAASHPHQHPQPIAPAPAPPGGRGPPVLRPMPPGGIIPQPGMNSPYGPGPLMQPNQPIQDGEQPTHVVGSQGRRGILPSAPGRPAAPAAGTGAAKSTVIPVKDADGKFPCPHCTKTYLHAKHLKRHLLRHTGDRPYMCVLCRDTFSRSDILKRHFQKCSIRRGNPTGASHLSHPQAHVKKNAQAQKAAGLGNEGDLNHLNGLNNMPPADGMVHPFGMVPVSDGMNSMAGDQSHLSRSNSMQRLENGAAQDRRSMPGMGNSQPYGNDGISNQQMPQYSMPPGQNGMPMYGGSNPNQQSGLDWSQMFQAGAHQTLNDHPFPPPNRGQTQIGTKTGPNVAAEPTARRPSDSVVYSEWGIPSNIENPYVQLSDQILNFFYPPTNEAIDPFLTGMNLHFSPDNVRDFICQYQNFHRHAPLLHSPSFRIMEAHPGLATSLCCIGACYSDRVEQSVVRDMMDSLWTAMERDCCAASTTSVEDAGVPSRTSRSGMERLQALLLINVLHVWNGTRQQRERARQMFPQIASQCRSLGLMHTPVALNVEARADHWMSWVERELRVRLMHAVFMCDTMWTLFCNMPPQLDPFDMALPLPCAEPAWDARGAFDWVAVVQNAGGSPTASGVLEQPETNLALRTLLHPTYRIIGGRMGTSGILVLVNSIISLIWRARRDACVDLSMHDALPRRDWIVSHASSIKTETGDGGHRLDPRCYTALSDALDKVKGISDEDATSITSCAPGSVMSSHVDEAFSMARRLLRATEPDDAWLTEEACFTHVLRLFGGAKARATDDEVSKAKDLGAMVDANEARHGIEEELVLHLTDFFDAVS